MGPALFHKTAIFGIYQESWKTDQFHCQVLVATIFMLSWIHELSRYIKIRWYIMKAKFMNSWNHESMPWASTYYFKCSSVAHKHSKEEHIVFLFHFEITSKKNLSIILQGKWRNLYIILHQLHLLHPLNPHKLKPTKGWRIERILMDLDASIWY